MNKQLRDGLNAASIGIAGFLGDIGQTVVSLLRLLVLSRAGVARQSRKYVSLKGSKDCCVLGNGPSLKDDFEAGRVGTEGNDVFCVNMFCISPLFKEIKPRFYFLVDGTYFAPANERGRQLVADLTAALNSVDWDMFLVVYSSAVSGGALLSNLNNSHIKVLRMNSTEVNGFRAFRHWAYRRGLGMPRCQTVINFALGAAVNMRYENVYLYGADHTWTRDLFVDDDNVVCYGDRHVYKKDLTVIKKEGNFAHLLDAFSNMFKSHYLMEEYSKSMGVKIWNCASDTYLDAYERMK